MIDGNEVCFLSSFLSVNLIRKSESRKKITPPIILPIDILKDRYENTVPPSHTPANSAIIGRTNIKNAPFNV